MAWARGLLMGIKRQWKVLKLSQLSVDNETRTKLIEAIMRRKAHTPVTLYAWKVDIPERITPEAFFTEQDAVKDWYLKKRIWENIERPSGVVLRKWTMCVDDIVRHIHNTKLRNLPVPLEAEIDVGVVPSNLHEDVQRSLKKQT